MLGALVRDRIQIVWLILVVATLISWGLGTSVPGNPHLAASIAILVVAFVKVRLIGRYFMELRRAPISLRILFDGYCFLLCAVLIGVFVSL